ncbi:MAG: hypothetical protein HQ518_10255 [Rhodopirellula sp.]|nr:hypothetical protein [Rhodopirellula sp.]
MQPLYTPENCHLAFQLRWSLALFERQPLPDVDTWRDRLAVAVERDGVRLLEVSFESPKSWLLLLSTRPDVAPSLIVKSVKGRLLRPKSPRHSSGISH